MVHAGFCSEDKIDARYLSPSDDRYEDLLRKHLWQKYNTVPNADPLPRDFDFKFILKGTPKSKLLTIKPYTPQQSKVRGFVFDFELTAPPTVHQLILNCGLGEKNASGFGWCEVISAAGSKNFEKFNL